MRTVTRQGREPHRELSPDLQAEAAALIDAARSAQQDLLALVTSLAAGTADGAVILGLADAGARLGENTAGLRDIAAALEDTAVGQFALTQAHAAGVAEGITIATARTRVPRQGKGRHASAGWRAGPIMTVVKVTVPAAAAGAWGALKALRGPVLRHAAKTGLAGHHAFVAAGVTTGVAAVALTAAVVTAHPVSPPRTWALPSVPAPAASVVGAVPITSPPAAGPSASRSAGADARAAGQVGIVPLVPWSPAPSPSASPSPSLTPAPVTGTLTVSAQTVDLTFGQPVTITLTASGGTVAWGAWCGGTDVVLSAGRGTAAPGAPSYLTFTPAPSQDGATTAECHVWPSGAEIAVLLPLPQPSASPAADPVTDTPAPDPSPS